MSRFEMNLRLGEGNSAEDFIIAWGHDKTEGYFIHTLAMPAEDQIVSFAQYEIVSQEIFLMRATGFTGEHLAWILEGLSIPAEYQHHIGQARRDPTPPYMTVGYLTEYGSIQIIVPGITAVKFFVNPAYPPESWVINPPPNAPKGRVWYEVDKYNRCVISANVEGREWIRELLKKINVSYIQAERMVIEALGLRSVSPEENGDLTDGAIFTDERFEWWDESYAIRSFIDTLADKGKVTVQFGRSHDTPLTRDEAAQVLINFIVWHKEDGTHQYTLKVGDVGYVIDGNEDAAAFVDLTTTLEDYGCEYVQYIGRTLAPAQDLIVTSIQPRDASLVMPDQMINIANWSDADVLAEAAKLYPVYKELITALRAFNDRLTNGGDDDSPFIIHDDTFGFDMTNDAGIPLRYATVDEALEEIRDWFLQQDDTQSFSVIDTRTGDTVGGHDRDDFEYETDEDDEEYETNADDIYEGDDDNDDESSW